MEAKTRKTGIDIIGDAPWGMHICQFYQTREDLIDVLVPYFKAGLENNEFCMWFTAEPLKVEDAKAALKKAVTDLDRYIKKGQIEILDYSDWYTKSGHFDSDKVLAGWIEKEKEALKKGFEGLRLTGNTFWLERNDWKGFTDYEAAINNVIGQHRMLAICSYSLDKCGAGEVIDVVSNHQFSLIRKSGKWTRIEGSERKKAQETLRLRAEIMNNMSEGVIVTRSSDAVIVYTNPKFEAMFGYGPGELIGRNISEVNAPNDKSPEESVEEIQKCLKENGVWRGEVYNIKKDGTPFWCYASVSTFDHHEHGRVWVDVHKDITERKKAEEETAKSKEKFRRLVENIPDVAWTSDYEGNTIYISPTVEKVYGYSPEEICRYGSQLWFGRIHPEDAESVKKAFRALIDENKKYDVRYRIQRKDGKWIWLHDRASVVYAKDSLFCVDGIFSDITAQKELEAEILEARMAAEAASRAKSVFLANMSHELHTPLNSIIGFSEVMISQDFGVINEKQRECTGNILSSGRQLLSIIDNMFELVRFEAGEIEISIAALTINNALEEAVHLLESKALRNDIHVLVEVPPEISRIESDGKMIKQVVFILLSNALKFTPNGGKAGIRAKRVDSGIEVSVWDTGIGIAKEDMDKLFQPFIQLEDFETKEHAGVGLGLVLAKKIVEKLGGTIRAESGGPATGATFTFTLPAIPPRGG